MRSSKMGGAALAPSPAHTSRCKLRPPEVARRYGVSLDKVHAWIKSGELRAFNAAVSRSTRPRFLIDEADLLAFEQSRAVVPPAPRLARRRKAIPRVGKFF